MDIPCRRFTINIRVFNKNLSFRLLKATIKKHHIPFNFNSKISECFHGLICEDVVSACHSYGAFEFTLFL